MRSNVMPWIAELEARVLRWTIDDITTPDLFKEQVGVISMEFSSMEEYLQAFRVPLLEEIRAQLHQALDKSISVQTASHGITTTIRKIVRPNPKKVRDEDKSSKKILEFHLPPNLGVKTSDLILLCSAKPRWDTKREHIVLKFDAMFVLACVVYVGKYSPMVSASVYVHDKSSILTKLQVKSVWHVVLPGVGLTPSKRIWHAINMPYASEKELITNTILRIDPQDIPIGTDHSLLTPQRTKSLQPVEGYSNSRGLNESQRDVLKSALAGLFAKGAKPHVRIVQGPPGTGKTAMLVTLISVLGSLQYRTLISAPTNAAVLEIAKRMMYFFDNSRNDEMFSSFSSRTQAGSNRCFPIALSNMVLLGSKERLQGAVDGTMLKKIFLLDRITRLENALSPRTGWKASVESVVRFLTKAPALFDAQDADAEESEEGCSKSSAKGKRSRTSKNEIKKEKKEQLPRFDSFWSFARASMVKLQAQMQKTSVVLTSELPKCHIDMTTSNAMTNACNLMAALVDLMPLEAPLEATTWFSTTTKADTLHERFICLSLYNSSSTTGKMEFLQARAALSEALNSSPGCSLFVTKKNKKGHCPSLSWLKSECLENATLVFSTVSGAGSYQMTRSAFECAIIDEASQLVEAETAIVMRKKGLKQLVLVGDHKQLPATVISKVAEKCGYRRSLFDRLQMLQHGCRHMLNIQYRMKPAISNFPNSVFYEGKVKDGPNVTSPMYGNSLHNAAAFGAYAFLDCRHGAEELQQKSLKNPKEVEVVTTLVTALGKVCSARNIEKLSVGVISPYVMQVEALKQSLNRLALHEALQVEVKTVDGFQGNERDVIIFSAVRSNQSRSIGFVGDCRRLNVAITRGRHCVWIVGNATTLSGGGKIWKKLVADAKARKCYHALQEDLRRNHGLC